MTNQIPKSKPLLPPMPEPHPTLSITVEVVLDHDFERYSNGNMRMTLDRADVLGDGEKIGHVAHVMPNGVVAKIGSRSYYLSPLALWNAINEAEGKGQE